MYDVYDDLCLGGLDRTLTSMLPAVATDILGSPSGVIALDGLHRVEGFFIGSVLHYIRSSGFVV